MAKIIRADEMARHINRLRKALSALETPPHLRTFEQIGEARGLLSYTINELTRACVADVVVENIAP